MKFKIIIMLLFPAFRAQYCSLQASLPYTLLITAGAIMLLSHPLSDTEFMHFLNSFASEVGRNCFMVFIGL